MSLKNVCRVLFFGVPLLGYACFLGTHFFSTPLQETKPLEIQASHTDDFLSDLYSGAIKEATNSIYLSIYTLKDPLIQKELQRQVEKGVTLTLFYDKASRKEIKRCFDERVLAEERKKSGLMHQKILVVDEKKVWIGSANLTEESLYVDDNLVVGFYNPNLAQAILKNEAFLEPSLAFYPIPEHADEAFLALMDLINHAKKNIRVALFNFTHPELIEALINAKNRGVAITCVLDRKSARGAGKTGAKRLFDAQIPPFLSSGRELFHHKFALIDDNTLVFGSANWTKAAFSKNEECMVMLKNLSDKERRKTEKLWHAISSTKEEYTQ